MKNIYKIKFHPLFYVTLFIVVITGYFKKFMLLVVIILFHELGHVLTGCFFKWKIKKISILPFGAITIFDEGLTKPLKEELLITIMGPLFQIIIYKLLKINYDVRLIHYSVLFFNLLPIIPLDGSKLLNVIFNFFLPFKLSYDLSIIISMISIAFIIIFSFNYKFNLVLLLVLLFLIIRVILEIKSRKYVIHRFLYERYYFPKKYNSIKYVNGLDISKFKKESQCFFKYNNNWYTEQDILRKMFDFKGKL